VKNRYEPVIGLEVHAELETKSKMFCACPVVDPTKSPPNIAVCPICSGMPGVLPVVNERAVEYALRVALALHCEINTTSIFARKNYFYPDLPKGYQISQYEQPLARNGILPIQTSDGEKIIRIRRVHLEEDTAKLSHVNKDGETYSLVDLNRAGVPLLEIVTEPDFRTSEEVRAYAVALRSLLRYLEVNSGDMQKGVMRIEPNVSVRPVGREEFGIRVEIKNLNSFRALERAVEYEIKRQAESLDNGIPVRQETAGWDVDKEVTFIQRVKEGEDDYRYFPEPDLPPLVIEPAWLEKIKAGLPELPFEKFHRFQKQYGLNGYDAGVLTAEKEVSVYFEKVLENTVSASPKMAANWLTGELFGLLNQAGASIDSLRIPPKAFAELLDMVARAELNSTTAKNILVEMFNTGKSASVIVEEQGLKQISDVDFISGIVSKTLHDNTDQVREYLSGKETIARWLFGQVMRTAGGKANPSVVQQELQRQLKDLKS